MPLRPDGARARRQAYRVEHVRLPAAGGREDEDEEREAWDVGGGELPDEAWAKLAFCVGVSNPLSLFFVPPWEGRSVVGFDDR